MSKVILRAISRNKWAGVKYYKNCATYLAPYTTRSGGLYTGFTAEDVETRERLERALQLDLTPASNYWTTYVIRIGDKDVYIDPSTPKGELDYIFLRNYKRVAKSLKDIKPSHDFVLIDENAEAETSNIYNRARVKAILEYNKMTMSEKRRALRLYGFNPDNISDEIVENRLLDYVEKDPNKYMSLWVNNKTRETEYMIKQAVSKGMITKNKNIYSYNDTSWSSLQDAIDYFDDPLYTEVKLAILKNINK
jgi:hypothetical protein